MMKYFCDECGHKIKLIKDDRHQNVGTCAYCDKYFGSSDLDRMHSAVKSGNNAANTAKQKRAMTRTRDGRRKSTNWPVVISVVGGLLSIIVGVKTLFFSETVRETVGTVAENVSARTNQDYSPVFIVGGEGRAPGQFKGNARFYGIDAQSNAYFESSSRVQVFDKDGVLTHSWINQSNFGSPLLLEMVLPNGNLVMQDGYREDLENMRRFWIVNGKTGEVQSQTDMPEIQKLLTRYNEEGGDVSIKLFNMPNGHIGFYVMSNRLEKQARDFQDALLVYDPQLQLVEQFENILPPYLPSNLEIDTNTNSPHISSVKINGQGTFYFLVGNNNDRGDERIGIYVFNKAGVFTEKYFLNADRIHGPNQVVSASSDVFFYHGWSQEIFDAKSNSDILVDVSTYFDTRKVTNTSLSAVEFYPNGDLGVLIQGNYFLRLHKNETAN